MAFFLSRIIANWLYSLTNVIIDIMKRSHLLLLLTAVFSFTTVKAQVTIAPTNLYIDDNVNFGTYMVLNNSDESQEVSIDFLFGYTINDESGNKTVVTSDSLLSEQYSIANNVRAFPRSFTLPPNQRQTVRLRVIPSGLENDGTYWARIRTSAVPVSPPIELTSQDAVTAQVGIVIEQVTGLFYKKGTVTTGIEIESIDHVEKDETLDILVGYNRTGNSPFLGTITAELLNADNTVAATDFVSTSLYFDGLHKQVLDISDVPAGSYTLKLSFVSSRRDISEDDIVQMAPVERTTEITITKSSGN